MREFHRNLSETHAVQANKVEGHARRTPTALFARSRDEGIPGPPAFLWRLRKAGYRWRGDINQMVASRALDLASGRLHAHKMLLAVRAFHFSDTPSFQSRLLRLLLRLRPSKSLRFTDIVATLRLPSGSPPCSRFPNPVGQKVAGSLRKLTEVTETCGRFRAHPPPQLKPF